MLCIVGVHVMSLRTLAVCTALLTSALGGGALAAPATYTFSTDPLAFNTVFNPNGSLTTLEQIGISNSIASVLAGTWVSGSFVYDSQAMQTGITGGGGAGDRGLVYGGHFLPGTNPPVPYSSFTSLAGSVNGGAPRTFTDPRGFTAVTNDGFQISCPAPCTPPPMVDSFEFGAESTTGPSIRNITGFGVDYRLFNVRMFWIETFLVPQAVPDLFDSESLPASPPSANGRLALHFGRRRRCQRHRDAIPHVLR
jgi:hypothetical protein